MAISAGDTDNPKADPPLTVHLQPLSASIGAKSALAVVELKAVRPLPASSCHNRTGPRARPLVPGPAGRVRAARAVKPARADRGDQRLVRARARGQPPRRRPADQAALRDPDQDPPAELHGVRDAARRPAGELRSYLVNGPRKALGFGEVPVRLALRSAKNPFDKG